MYSGRQYWNGGALLGRCYAWDSSFKDGLHTPIHARKSENASTGSDDSRSFPTKLPQLKGSPPWSGLFCEWCQQIHDL